MCQPTSKNGQQNESPPDWQEEAIRQHQLYPDLSEFLNTFLASPNSDSVANARETPQEEQNHRQSVLQSIISLLANNLTSESTHNHAAQENVSPTSNRDTNVNSSQPKSKERPHKESTSCPENNSEPNANSPRSHPSAPPQESKQDDSRHSRCPYFSGNDYHYGLNSGCDSRRRPQGMPWNFQHQGCYNMNDERYGTNNWNRIPRRSLINPELSYLLSTFMFGCFKATAFLTCMVALFGFLWVVPHTLMAIGLAIAVIRSITRIPIVPLIAGSAFIAILLYMDSQLLMLMCVYAIFKSVVMGRPLVNRQFWRRCCQME